MKSLVLQVVHTFSQKKKKKKKLFTPHIFFFILKFKTIYLLQEQQ